ncbi:cytochrome P450 [Spinellus fusiger]|nr:cytochrome P450 [Spinellus fusiger]
MGVQDFIFISDPTIAHEIFNVNGSITTSRPPNKYAEEIYSMYGRGLAYPIDKKKFKESRSASSIFLAPKIIDQLGDSIQFETTHLIDQLMSHRKNDGVDPFHDLTFRSLNVMTRVCFGTRFESTNDPIFISFLEIIYLTMLYLGVDENIDTYLPALGFISYLKGRDRKRQDFINNLRNPVFRKMIKEAIEKDEDCVVKRMRNIEDKSLYDDDDILMVVAEMTNGGTDTISVTLSRTFVVLSHHPEIQKKICEEIDAFITKYKRLPMFKERDDFPYMISVQREIMRLYPTTAYGVPHMAEKDFVLNNYFIKKGTVLISDMYSMHRNPDVYPDPEKFIPERFINIKSTFHASANGNPTERDQYNFGWGRHICPGIYLAEAEMFLTYTTLFARCTIEPSLDSNGNPVYGDIDSYVDGGLTVMTKTYKIRLVERPDKLL